MAELVTFEARGSIALVGLNRPDKRNAFTLGMMGELAAAYSRYAADDGLRCLVLFAHGEHFCGGLELASAAEPLMTGGKESFVPDGGVDPWGVHTPRVLKPVISAVRGYCLTLAIELLLAGDIVVAARDAKFAQLEVTRGIFPFGGVTVRFPQAVGWQNAMRWLLTGDFFDAAEAHRIGLAQQLVEPGEELAAALAIAERVAAAAPLGIATTLRSARAALDEGQSAVLARLYPDAAKIHATEDARLGIATFLDRNRPTYQGR